MKRQRERKREKLEQKEQKNYLQIFARNLCVILMQYSDSRSCRSLNNNWSFPYVTNAYCSRLNQKLKIKRQGKWETRKKRRGSKSKKKIIVRKQRENKRERQIKKEIKRRREGERERERERER